MKKRVVITGVGLVTPLGLDTETTWENIKAGKSGLSEISNFDASESPVRVAAELRGFEESGLVDPKELKRFDGFVNYSVAASGLAIKDANLVEGTYDPYRVGVLVGSGIGGLQFMEPNISKVIRDHTFKVTPFFIPGAIINMASGNVSIKYGFKGPNFSIVSACASGAHSIGEATRMIQYGTADVMLAGGSESSVCAVGIAGFASLKALSRGYNDEPTRASRPFDKDRDGFVMGEGAGVLVLESYDHAKARGANIIAEIVGYAATSDAYHITAPDENGDGAIRCIKLALDDAGIEPTDIDYINAHGTSTKYNDSIETKAIKAVFGDHAYKLNISSTKSMVGHMLGAAGGVECAFSAFATRDNFVPPTINLDTPDPECDLNYTPNKGVEREVRYALSNSLGFGGTNSVLIVKKYEG